jgi:pimeloyl-ACP methyl ester carboxylesterase
VNEVALSAGLVEYEDTGGTGPTLLLLHGLLMDATLWDAVVPALADHHRCVIPTLPLGAHRIPMPDADLSPQGVAHLVAELLDALDLEDVTVVGNDTGSALTQLLICAENRRIRSIVLVSCEAFTTSRPA